MQVETTGHTMNKWSSYTSLGLPLWTRMGMAEEYGKVWGNYGWANKNQMQLWRWCVVFVLP